MVFPDPRDGVIARKCVGITLRHDGPGDEPSEHREEDSKGNFLKGGTSRSQPPEPFPEAPPKERSEDEKGDCDKAVHAEVS